MAYKFSTWKDKARLAGSMLVSWGAIATGMWATGMWFLGVPCLTVISILGAMEQRKKSSSGIVQVGADSPYAYLIEKVAVWSRRAGISAPKVFLRTSWGEDVPLDRRESYYAVERHGRERVVVFTPEALAKKRQEAETDFIIAHELGHVRVDGGKFSPVSGFVREVFPGVMLVFTAMSALASFIGGGIFLTPIPAAAGVAIGVASAFTCFFAESYASRVVERRADRNAVYLTQDFNSAVKALARLGGKEMKAYCRKKPYRGVFATHPFFRKRIAYLKEAFKYVSRYPAPTSSSDISPKGPGAALS